jgi:preprotein translocase subunit SecD
VRRYVLQLMVAIGLIALPLVAVLATSTTPQLGLDLQGGISVVLGPKGAVRSDALGQAVEIIRNRVDSLGVAEPEVNLQGNNIIVDLPGVKDRDRARSLVGQTAELRFRHVLQVVPGNENEAVTTTTTAPAVTPTTAAGGSSTTATTTQKGVVAGQTAGTTAPTGTTATTAPETTPTTVPELTGKVKTTEDKPDEVVVLPVRKEAANGRDIRLRLDKSELTGKAVKSAQANFQSGQGWVVNLTFTDDGSKGFDAMAAKYVGQQVAIVLDGVVQSYPTIQTKEFNGRAVISGNFKEKEAKDLALVLRYGALPVALEERTVQEVSPTLGRDQLKAGVVAGLIGLALVAIYMLLYYRLLGMVIWAGLLLAAGALYALTSWLGSAIGLTLTLAGVTGIIVSVGITVDSYVVYFERLKDEVRTGKTIRSSLDRGFARSFRTILAADFVSLIGAALLYFLAVGSVRGFAFFLGLSTLLDIFVAYFFMHPLVSIIGRKQSFTKAGWLGIASGLGMKEATA